MNRHDWLPNRNGLRLVAYASVVAFCLACSGCGSPHGTVKVSGQVTVGGQPPPGAGTITFTVVEPAAGFPSRPAMAQFGADGQYVTTSYDPGDGLVPGTYRVAVECYQTPPNMEGKPVRSYIDEKYTSGATSGFALTVEPRSGPIVFNIELE